MPQMNPYERPSRISPGPQLHLSLIHCVHIKHAVAFEVFFFPFFFSPPCFLPALPNGLMDRGCICGTQVWGDRCVLSPVSGKMCETLHKVKCACGFIIEIERRSKKPPPFRHPIPSYWLAAVVILYQVMQICACAWLAITFQQQRLVGGGDCC